MMAYFGINGQLSQLRVTTMNEFVQLCGLSYLDPGAGSLLIQALLGGAAGLLVAFRHFWQTIKAGQQADSAGKN